MAWRKVGPPALLLVAGFLFIAPSPAASNRGQAVPLRGIGYGIISEPERRNLVADLGFNWVKYLVQWKDSQPDRSSRISFDPYDDWVDQARALGLRVLLRVDAPPAWATGATEHNAPPLDDADLAEFMYQMALHFKGRVDAWEIWNEPNITWEWGMRRPDPAKLASMLKAVYPRVKAADPNTFVIIGGLSTTGGDFEDNGNEIHIGDLGYLTLLARAGAQGYFDAIGSHPYGGPYPPEKEYDINNSSTPVGLYFRRTELQHEAWQRATGQDVAIWLTEFGWIQDFGWNCTWADSNATGRMAQKVSPQQQAAYLAGAFPYARANWPWIGPMIMFNLDKAVDTPSSCDENHQRFFGILNPNGSPTPAYTALKSMSKVDNLAPISRLESLPAYSQGSFTLRWTGADDPGGSGLRSYDVQRREGSGPWTNLLPPGTTLTSTTVSGSDGQRLSFRVRARDGSGNAEDYRSEDGDVSTVVDASAPSSAVLVYSVPVTSSFSFPVRWSGADTGSGVSRYDVQYRDRPGGGAWTDLAANTALTATDFFLGQDRQAYYFRSRARDGAGNLEDYPAEPDAQMVVSISPYITTPVGSPVWMGERGRSLPPQTIRVTNGGAFSTPWQASSSAAWLSVSPTSGSLAPGAAATLTLSITAPIAGAGTSRYDASVVITGTAAWNGPVTLNASLYAVDSLRTAYLPLLVRQGSGW